MSKAELRSSDRILGQILGHSSAFLTQKEKLPQIAHSDVAVLITGETGTGKELFARAIHYLSPRASEPFVPINCGAIPIDLFESELFGHQRYAFTGAAVAREGMVAEAEGGTLFLDEVDSLAEPGQAKLLRFLESMEYRRLGAARYRTADIRVIAAANSDVEAALEAGSLRSDLYYRLGVIQLALPPLRDRREDIPLLARHFLEKFAAQEGRPQRPFAVEALRCLIAHSWPGNVRELENAVHSLVVLGSDLEGPIRPREIRLGGGGSPAQDSFKAAKQRAIARFERGYVEAMLACCDGNISQAARTAKKDRRSFWELVRRHGIEAERFRRPPG